VRFARSASGDGQRSRQLLGQKLKGALQLGEALRPQNLRDPQLRRPSLGVDCLLESPSLGSEPDHPGPSVGRIGYAPEVPVLFQVPEQVIDRLFRNPRLVCQLAWTSPVEAWIAPKPDMCGIQIVISRRNDARIHLIADPLPDDAQRGADVPR
jgi:hypothetical protein